MTEIEELPFGLKIAKEVIERQIKFLAGQNELLKKIATKLEAKQSVAQKTITDLITTYQPNSNGGFLEVEGFSGFKSLQFFYDVGKILDNAFSPSLSKLLRIERTAKAIAQDSDVDGLRLDSLDNVDFFVDLLNQTGEVIDRGVFPFERVVKDVYQKAIAQFKYLQKRFLNVGADDSRAYRHLWEDNEQRVGFDITNIPYIKIKLVRDNPLLTDLLLDIAEQLPREHTRKEKVKGKRTKEVKFLDPFDVDRVSRTLVELADPTYQGYVRDAHSFLIKVGDTIRNYHEVLSYIYPSLKDFLGAQEDNPLVKMKINPDVLRVAMPDPNPVISRLTEINYNGIRQNGDEVRPSSQLEKRHFAARDTLMEHLVTALDSIETAQSCSEKVEIARAAVEKGVELRERVREALETISTIKLKKDENVDNEFYVVTSDNGEFGFKREAAPNVKLTDVVGKSFDVMKQHLADLVEYSKYLNLFGATAPRGKIKSNILAIGPYGCGKTEISRAIAGDPRFIGAEVSVTNLLSYWFGEFEKNVDRVWNSARELRRNSGDSKLVFLIMDEFDSFFGSSNDHWTDNIYQRVQKAIQRKLDGVVDYEGIIVVGLTNEPKKIPLAIYRRFKYVDIVGELEPQERAYLLKQFLSNGLPLSNDFTSNDYQKWGNMLEGATGDVIGKIADDIHYEFMRRFINEYPTKGRRLNERIREMQLKSNGELDKSYVKRVMERYMLVTPDLVEKKIRAKLDESIIKEQIKNSTRVYAEARAVLASQN